MENKAKTVPLKDVKSEVKSDDKVILIKKNRSVFSNQRTKKGYNARTSKYISEIIERKRIVKVVKGGRKFRFSILLVVGDKKGSVGFALGKANEIPNAARKARARAEKSLFVFELDKVNGTIAHSVTGKYSKSLVIMHPAKKGTGVIAGGSARTVLELCGIENIYTKVHGSRNKLNIIKATLDCLKQLKQQQYLYNIRLADKNGTI